MTKLKFEAKINEVYNGAVKPLTSYINRHATMWFKCDQCGLKFFGKPSHILGKEHQRHLCGFPYGDKNGERLQYVSATKPKRKKKESLNIEQLNKMVWEDYSYQQIAQELQVNPNIFKDYFKEEGLIE